MDLAREAVQRQVDALVVCGGDGITHMGLQAAAGTEVPLGVIPAGTGNDTARYLGIDRKDPGRAADVVIAGHTSKIDLGLATEDVDGQPSGAKTWFVTVAATGFVSKVNDRANRMKWPSGRSRYDLSMLVELGVFQPTRYRIDLDGSVVETDAMMVAVGNGSSFGGGMRVTAQASLHDGVFDVLYLPPMSKAKFVALFPSVYTGGHLDRPEIELRRARRVRVAAQGGTAYADGERIGTLPMTFQTVPDAINVFVPPEHVTT